MEIILLKQGERGTICVREQQQIKQQYSTMRTGRKGILEALRRTV